MTRKRVRMELISHGPTRLATFKKRKASVFKKASELSILCGVPVCVVVSDGPNHSNTEVWPQSEEASEIISKFNSLSESEQTKKMVDKDGFISQQIAKMQMQLQKVQRENQDLEAELLLRNLVSGRSSISDVQDKEIVARLQMKVEMQIKEINKRTEQLLSGEVPLQASHDAGCGTSSMAIVAVPHKNFPPLVDESAEKDEICEFDVASLPLWWLEGEEEMPRLAETETSDQNLKSNGTNVTSLLDWCMVEKEMSESLDQSRKKDSIFESSSANADVASLQQEADVPKSLDQSCKKDSIFESSSADVASLQQDQISEEMIRLFDEFGDCSSYYCSDQEMAEILSTFCC